MNATPETLALMEELIALFVERHYKRSDIRQALINLLVSDGVYDGLTPQVANQALAEYFKDAATKQTEQPSPRKRH